MAIAAACTVLPLQSKAVSFCSCERLMKLLDGAGVLSGLLLLMLLLLLLGSLVVVGELLLLLLGVLLLQLALLLLLLALIMQRRSARDRNCESPAMCCQPLQL